MYDKVFEIRVHLSREEWGNELMDKIANEVYEAHKDKAGDVPLVIIVYEHAGWSLGYAMIEGKLQTCYSANDAAVYHGAKKAFRENAYHAKWEALVPEIWREPR